MARWREQRSLFGEILNWMLLPLLVLWPMSVALTWLVAQGIANQPFDRELAAKVRLLGREVSVQAESARGLDGFAMPPRVAEALRPDDEDDTRYQVRNARGEVPQTSAPRRWSGTLRNGRSSCCGERVRPTRRSASSRG